MKLILISILRLLLLLLLFGINDSMYLPLGGVGFTLYAFTQIQSAGITNAAKRRLMSVKHGKAITLFYHEATSKYDM